jgi:hypothetical protein
MARYSGTWHCAVWRLVTYFQEESAASSNCPEVGSSDLLKNDGIYLPGQPEKHKKTVFLIPAAARIPYLTEEYATLITIHAVFTGNQGKTATNSEFSFFVFCRNTA